MHHGRTAAGSHQHCSNTCVRFAKSSFLFLKREKDDQLLPFLLLNIWNAALAGMGYDFDLVGAYQSARLAMIPVGKQAVHKLLARREAVLAAIGNYLWPELPYGKDRRKRAKGVINAYDMGASVDFWQHNKSWGGNPHKRSLNGKYLTTSVR